MGSTANSEHTTAKLQGETELVPVLPLATLTVTGTPRELVASVQSLLRNELTSRAILSLHPDATSDISVRLSKVKEVTFTVSRGELSIELPSGTKSTRVQDMVTRALVRESVFSSLAHFARTGSESPHSRDLILNLTQLASKKSIPNDSELRRELTTLVKSSLQDLSSHLQECSKRATRTSAGSMGSFANATKNIDVTFDLLARLRALSWSSLEPAHADLFDTCGAQCLEALNNGFMQHWDSCHRSSNLDGAEQTISLYEKLHTELKRSGFVKTPPHYLLPSRDMASPASLEQKTAILRRGGLLTNPVPRSSAFTTHFLRLLPEAITSTRSTVRMEREIQSWQAPTKNATHLIHADLFSSIPGAVEAAKAIKTIPETLSPDLEKFARSVGHLKHHGGVEGLETHCMIIAPGSWIDETNGKEAVEGGDLHRQLRSLAQTNIGEYLNLIEIAATWAHRSTDVKIDLVQTYQEKLNILIARGLWGSITEVLFVLHATIGGEFKLEDVSDALHSDRIADLAKPAAELSASIRSPELSTVLRTLATQTIPHLAAAKRALEINAIPWPEILDHTHKLPTTFENSPFGDFVKLFVTDLHAELLSRADEFTTETESLLSSSYDEGDSGAFCVAASKALAHAAKSNYPENSKTKLIVTIDAWTLKFINLAHAAVEHDLHVQEATLRSNSTSQRTIATGIETLSFFVDAMAPLRELLLSNRSVIPAARLNHFQSTALKTIHLAPIISSAFVRSLRDELTREDADPRTIQHARFVASLSSIASRLPEQAKDDLTAILKLIKSC